MTETPKREPSCTLNHDMQRRTLRDKHLPPTPCLVCGWVLSASRETVDPVDDAVEVAALRQVVQELTDKIQFLVEWLDKHGLLEDHGFTFPDGDFWKTQDEEKTAS